MLHEAAKARGDDQALISLVERGRADLAQLLKREGLPDAEDGDGESAPTPGDWTR